LKGIIMADQMFVVLTVRMPVQDKEAGKTVYELLKTKLEQWPTATLTGHCTEHINLVDEPID